MYNRNTICGVRSSVQNGIHSIYSGAGILDDRQGLLFKREVRGVEMQHPPGVHRVHHFIEVRHRRIHFTYNHPPKFGNFGGYLFTLIIGLSNPRSSFLRIKRLLHRQSYTRFHFYYIPARRKILHESFQIRFSRPNLVAG